MRSVQLVAATLSSLLAASCSAPTPVESPSPGMKGLQEHEPVGPAAPAADSGAEVAVQAIPLRGPASSREAEFSGLAWYKDHLILLPQFPERFESAHDGTLFAISEPDLQAALTADAQPIAPKTIDLVAPGLLDNIPDMQGMEAIAFWADKVFIAIETGYGNHMTGYIVAGTIAPDLSRITLDTTKLAKIPARAAISNASEETLVATGDRVIAIFEANGANINPTPVAHVFDHSLQALGTVPFPGIEYRVIDATAIDDQKRFWVSNYFYTGDRERYDPAEDAIASTYGEGKSHQGSDTVERLVLLEYDGQRVKRVERAPIQLELGAGGRNWEGLVRWPGRGFLLVTDMFPDTILALAPYPGLPGQK